MRVKAGDWQKMKLIDKANLLIDEKCNNTIAFQLRKIKKQKNNPTHWHV